MYMSQNISDNIQRKVNNKKALGVAFDVGVLWGVRMGIISSLMIFLAIFWGSVSECLLVFTVWGGGWLVMSGLGGAFAAKRTGHGAGIGAYCGLFLASFAIVLTVIGILIEIFVYAMLINYRVIPESWAITGGNPNGIGDLAIALPFVAIGAFIASFGIGPLLRALGGGVYRSFADTRRGQQ